MPDRLTQELEFINVFCDLHWNGASFEQPTRERGAIVVKRRICPSAEVLESGFTVEHTNQTLPALCRRGSDRIESIDVRACVLHRLIRFVDTLVGQVKLQTSGKLDAAQQWIASVSWCWWRDILDSSRNGYRSSVFQLVGTFKA